jgi:hypothetical protein
MIRLALRLAGLLLLAGGFAELVVDGARSLAAGAVSLAPMSALVEAALPGRLAVWGRTIAGVSAVLWDPVLTGVLAAPAFAVLALAGCALLLLARPRRDASPGFVRR